MEKDEAWLIGKRYLDMWKIRRKTATHSGINLPGNPVLAVSGIIPQCCIGLPIRGILHGIIYSRRGNAQKEDEHEQAQRDCEAT
jgi:hypothetical protein